MKDSEKRALLRDLNKIYNIEDLDISAINLEISQEDTMFVQSDEDHYYNVGLSGLKQILLSLSSAQKDKSEIKTILDFPSGWGRELRFIKAYFPDADITAGEIEESALSFCRDQFGVNIILSHAEFAQIPMSKKFDLIWCGSLITHLDKTSTINLINFFYDALNDDGILSFTTQGRYAQYLLDTEKYLYNLEKAEIETLKQQYDLTGYGHVNYKGRKDYGISLIKPAWIIELLEKNKNWTIILYNEKGYDDHQDVITCLKRPVSYIPKRPWFNRWIDQQICPQ